MNQLISTVISFLIIPILLRNRMKLSTSLAITALVLAVLSMIGIHAIGNIVLGLLVTNHSRDAILTVLIVSTVGGTMKHYKLLDKVVESLLNIFRSRKIVLMIIPSMIGTLTIPGGAVLSAPFVDNIGADAGLKPPQRAAVNLIFRHISTMVFPFSIPILFLRSASPDINVYLIILYNLAFLLLMLTFAHYLFLRRIEANVPISQSDSCGFQENFRRFLIFTAPIYVPVLLNAILGIPLFAAMLVSLVIVYAESEKEKFLWVLRKSANWDILIIIISVLIIKDIILQMDEMLMIFDNIFSRTTNSLSMMTVFMGTSLFFGFITGNITVPLAVTLPMLSRINMSNDLRHVFTYYLMISAFLGYYFSPLHLCQSFTLKVMQVTIGELYKEYTVYAMVSQVQNSV
ncbi:MAG: DUF401 family protein [Bacillota bacterium]|nr:DUF401 family protein [Bacillota bacterium]